MATKAQIVVLGTTSLLSLAIGATAGYFFARKQLWHEFDEQLAKEVATAKQFYSRLHKREEHDMPSTIVETPEMLPVEREAAAAMRRYQGNNTSADTPSEEPVYETVKSHLGVEIQGSVDNPTSVENNVFDSTPNLGVDDYEELIRNRTEEAPYVITLAEHLNNEFEYEQDSLVYFLGDGILVDDRDDVVDDPDMVVGDDNLVKFGHFSGDPRKVYVRNDRLGHDFEITSHEGSYAFVVHGIQSTKNAKV